MTAGRDMLSDELVGAMELLHQYPRLIAERAAKEARRAALTSLRERVAGLFPSSFPATHVSPDASDPASYAIGEGSGMSQMKSAVLDEIKRALGDPD